MRAYIRWRRDEGWRLSLAQQGAEQAVAGQELSRLAWMALALTPGMGPTRIWKAIKRLGAAERLFEASLTELEGLGMPAKSAQFCFEGRSEERRVGKECRSRWSPYH